jgi:hypothetical protein
MSCCCRIIEGIRLRSCEIVVGFARLVDGHGNSGSRQVGHSAECRVKEFEWMAPSKLRRWSEHSDFPAHFFGDLVRLFPKDYEPFGKASRIDSLRDSLDDNDSRTRPVKAMLTASVPGQFYLEAVPNSCCEGFIPRACDVRPSENARKSNCCRPILFPQRGFETLCRSQTVKITLSVNLLNLSPIVFLPYDRDGLRTIKSQNFHARRDRARSWSSIPGNPPGDERADDRDAVKEPLPGWASPRGRKQHCAQTVVAIFLKIEASRSLRRNFRHCARIAVPPGISGPFRLEIYKIAEL